MTSADRRAILISMLSEKLASKGMEHEMIAELMDMEKKSLSKLPEFEVVKLPTGVRSLVFNFLGALSSHVADPITSYLKAAQLFDFSAQRTLGEDTSLGYVLALAAAAWLVSSKMMSLEGPHLRIEQVVAKAEEMAGFPVMTLRDVQQQEMTLVMSFNISSHSLCTWYDLFSARLDAIFDGALQESGHLQQLQRVYLSVLNAAINSREVSEENPGYMIAAGSFCFALAVTGLVPVAEVIHPSAKTFVQMPDNASIEAKLAWFSQRCRLENLLGSSPPPAQALVAGTQVAVHCSAQVMQRATALLVAYI